MKYLVGDIGNTFIKISILNHKFDIQKSYKLNTNKIYKKKNINIFFKKFLNNSLNNKALFSSVVPKAYKLIKMYLKKKNLKLYEVKELQIKISIILKISINIDFLI